MLNRPFYEGKHKFSVIVLLVLFVVNVIFLSGCVRTKSDVLSVNCKMLTEDKAMSCHYDKAMYLAIDHEDKKALKECQKIYPQSSVDGFSFSKVFPVLVESSKISYYNDCLNEIVILSGNSNLCSYAQSESIFSAVSSLISDHSQAVCLENLGNEQYKESQIPKIWKDTLNP